MLRATQGPFKHWQWLRMVSMLSLSEMLKAPDESVLSLCKAGGIMLIVQGGCTQPQYEQSEGED